MSHSGEIAKEQNHRRLDADHVQATVHQIHEPLRVEMSHSQAILDERAREGRILAPYIPEGSQNRLDAQYIRTTRLTRKLDWKRLGPFTAVRR